MQQELGLSSANKWKTKHIHWQKFKMTQFHDSEATTEFIKYIDFAFDLMNSRNPFTRKTKQPVTHSNIFPHESVNLKVLHLTLCLDVLKYCFALTNCLKVFKCVLE